MKHKLDFNLKCKKSLISSFILTSNYCISGIFKGCEFMDFANSFVTGENIILLQKINLIYYPSGLWVGIPKIKIHKLKF